METTQLVKGVLDLAVLAVVSREDGYGYDVVRRIRAAGAQPCQDAARDRAEDPLDYEWGLEGPDEAQWAAGQRFVRCWAPR